MVKTIRKKGKVIGYQAQGHNKIYKVSVYGDIQAQELARKHENG